MSKDARMQRRHFMRNAINHESHASDLDLDTPLTCVAKVQSVMYLAKVNKISA